MILRGRWGGSSLWLTTGPHFPFHSRPYPFLAKRPTCVAIGVTGLPWYDSGTCASGGVTEAPLLIEKICPEKRRGLAPASEHLTAGVLVYPARNRGSSRAERRSPWQRRSESSLS